MFLWHGQNQYGFSQWFQPRTSGWSSASLSLTPQQVLQVVVLLHSCSMTHAATFNPNAGFTGSKPDSVSATLLLLTVVQHLAQHLAQQPRSYQSSETRSQPYKGGHFTRPHPCANMSCLSHLSAMLQWPTEQICEHGACLSS